jgi:phosphoserine phosphatase
VRQIRQDYKRHVVEDATAVINALQTLGHQVYIISGGLEEPVVEFGLYLGVPRQHIRAVGINYNQLSGHWWESQPGEDQQYLAYEEGALTASEGKAQIVQELLGDQHGRTLLIGDGQSDLLAGTAVDPPIINLFIGYGGVITRPRVLAAAPAFIHSASLAPLLALAAGPSALNQLRHTLHQPIAQKATHLIETGAITFTDEQLKTKFHSAYRATTH